MYPYMKLTLRQQAILDYVKDFIRRAGYAPSLREICAQFNIKSPANAGKHLAALEKKGYLRRSGRLSRAIIPVEGATDGDAYMRSEAGAGLVSVPIAGVVRAGAPHLAIEDITGRVSLDPSLFKCLKSDNAFLLKVKGQSMIEAGMDDGDHVLVRPQASAENGDIVVAMLGGEATVKRFLRDEKGGVVLKPENSAMQPIIVTADTADFSIIGRVVSVIKMVG